MAYVKASNNEVFKNVHRFDNRFFWSIYISLNVTDGEYDVYVNETRERERERRQKRLSLRLVGRVSGSS